MLNPYIVIPFVALLVFSGCEEDPHPADDTTDEPRPASIAVGVLHQRPDVLEFQVDDRTVRVDTFVVTFGVTEFHLCERATRTGFELFPSAWAHVPSTGTRLGTVFAEDLTTTTKSAQIVGDFEPIHGTYCSAVLVAAPADDDVLNATPVSTDELLGHSLVVRGTIDGEPFDWKTSAAVTAKVSLDRIEVGPGTHHQLLFDKTVTEGLFEGFDELESDEARAQKVLERLMESVTRWTS